MCAHYFSYYDIPRDTNLEIEKLPVGEIMSTRFVANEKRDVARGRKNELLYSELSGLHRPRMRAKRVISVTRNRIYRDFDVDRIQIDITSHKASPLIASSDTTFFTIF